MHWSVIVFCVIGAWGMLRVFGSERVEQVRKIEAETPKADEKKTTS